MLSDFYKNLPHPVPYERKGGSGRLRSSKSASKNRSSLTLESDARTMQSTERERDKHFSQWQTEYYNYRKVYNRTIGLEIDEELKAASSSAADKRSVSDSILFELLQDLESSDMTP